MTTVLYVRLEGFALREVRKRQSPEKQSMPLVVHDGASVLERCPEAARRGVMPGMCIKESKTLLKEDGHHEKLKPEELREASCGWLDLCAECSSVVEPAGAYEAYLDLKGHPCPMSIAGELTSRIWKAENLEISAGLSSTKWLSKLSAQPCDPQALSLGIPAIFQIADAPAFVASMPVSAVPLLQESVKLRFEFLGCRFVHQALALSPQNFKKQFGKEAGVIRAVLEARAIDKVEAVYPSESITVTQAFEGAVEDRQVIDMSLADLAGRLASRMAQLDKQAEALRLTSYDEGGAWDSHLRKLGKPIVAASQLLVGMKKLLDDHPLPFPVVRFSARAENLTSRKSWQQTLSGALPQEQRESAVSSAARVVEAMFGEGRVMPASQVVLSRRERVLRAWRHATGWH